MIRYIIRRILGSIPLLFGITLVSFLIIHLAPGKPTALENALNPKISLEVRERLEKLYGFDKPIHIQYITWLSRLVRLDFGRSIIDDRVVLDKILERVPLTLSLNIASLILILVLGIAIGIKSATRAGSVFDKSTTAFVFIAISMPSFWVALILMSFLGVKLGWLPVSGIVSLDFEYLSWPQKFFDITKHLILPIFIITFSGLAGISRYMRSSMLEVLEQPYIRTARAKGLPQQWVIYKHALRNALLPIITIVGLSIPGLLGGSVIIETIFALPGLGKLFFEAVFARDYFLIMAEIVIVAALTFLGNLLADISYAYADPRIRYQK